MAPPARLAAAVSTRGSALDADSVYTNALGSNKHDEGHDAAALPPIRGGGAVGEVAR
jgi:hypothetical protein